MTSFDVERLPFTSEHLRSWQADDRRFINWPVVYILDDGKRVYVGGTLNTAARIRQHLESAERKTLKAVRLVLDDTFNKSVCLDLESQLIALLAADEKFTVLNSTKGIVDADYYDRPRYRYILKHIFDALREQEVFTRSLPEIENRELFKLSPFKALNRDQAIAMEDILEGLFDDWEDEAATPVTVQGDPGAGKTIVAVYLLKLLRDLAQGKGLDELGGDALFSDFFTVDNHRLLAGSRLGLVVPQQALRASLKRVFAKTPGLEKTMVLTPFEVGKSNEPWDLLVVDESHRLNHRANQASGMQNNSFGGINEKLFGADVDHLTQEDWTRKQSRHQIFLIDSHQSVRPADLPQATQNALIEESEAADRRYRLFTQMRVQGGADYVSFARALLSDKPRARENFGAYDVRFFDDLGEMQGRDPCPRRRGRTLPPNRRVRLGVDEQERPFRDRHGDRRSQAAVEPDPDRLDHLTGGSPRRTSPSVRRQVRARHGASTARHRPGRSTSTVLGAPAPGPSAACKSRPSSDTPHSSSATATTAKARR